MPEGNPWDVPIQQPVAAPQVQKQSLVEALIKGLFGGDKAAAAQALSGQGQAAGPVFSGQPLDALAEQLKKQKQVFALGGGQPPPQ